MTEPVGGDDRLTAAVAERRRTQARFTIHDDGYRDDAVDEATRLRRQIGGA